MTNKWQIDVLFPSSKAVEANFIFGGRYGTAQAGLAEVYEYYMNQPASRRAGTSSLLPKHLSQPSSDYTVCLCIGAEEDKWCVDPRGILTLSVTKDTFQRLGLAGEKLPFKGYSDQFGMYTYRLDET